MKKVEYSEAEWEKDVKNFIIAMMVHVIYVFNVFYGKWKNDNLLTM